MNEIRDIDDAPPGRDRSLETARALTRLLDDALRIPGTDFRVGLDPIVGLIPGAGDLVGGAMSAYLLLIAQRAGAPTSVLIRMLGNLAVDAAVGAVPLLGDLFDAGWKANRRNLRIVERYIERPVEVRRGSRMWLAVALLAVVVLTAAGIAATLLIVRLLLSLL